MASAKITNRTVTVILDYGLDGWESEELLRDLQGVTGVATASRTNATHYVVILRSDADPAIAVPSIKGTFKLADPNLQFD